MLLQRFIAWASQAIVRNLSHNKTFQQFALHVDDKITKVQKGDIDIAKTVVESAKKVDVNKSVSGVMDFLKKVHSNVK
eukprot:scaffold423_cov185-Ochromonas_danica.AAC.7